MRAVLTGKVAVFLLAFIFTVPAVSAQETPPAENASDATTQVIEVASVNVYDARIAKQDGRQLEVAFQLANGQGVQTGLSYGIQLSRMLSSTAQEDAGFFLVPAKISLKENETRDQTFALTVPDYLPGGDYLVRVVAGGPSGMLFGFNQAGIVGIPEVKADRVELRDCTVRVGSEGATTIYALGQGVDVAPYEDLQLVCQAFNPTDHELAATPNFTTFRRTLLSGQVADTAPATPQTFSLAPGVVQQIILPLPLARTPQAYDVETFLTDPSGKRLSQGVTAHYVLRGPSATFQNVLFDKASYNQGDEARVTYTWVGSADGFPDSRAGQGTDTGALAVSLTLRDAQGHPCAEPLKKPLNPQTLQETAAFAITRGCSDPTLEAAIAQENGTVLDRTTLETNPRPQPMFGNVKLSWKQRLGEYPWAYGALILIGVVLLAILLWKLGRKGRGVAMVMILSGLVFLSGAGEVGAASVCAQCTGYACYSQSNTSGGDSLYYCYTYNLSTNSYVAGTDVRAGATGYVGACDNVNFSSRTLKGYGRSTYSESTNPSDYTLIGSGGTGTIGGGSGHGNNKYYAFDTSTNIAIGKATRGLGGTGWASFLSEGYTPAGVKVVSGTSPLTYTVTDPPPTNQAPVGAFSSANCSSLGGYTYDPDTTNNIDVHIYKDGPAGGGGSFLAYGTASIGNHGFNITTPASVKDGAQHTLYAYGIDSAGAGGALIGTQTLTCAAPENWSCGSDGAQIPGPYPSIGIAGPDPGRKCLKNGSPVDPYSNSFSARYNAYNQWDGWAWSCGSVTVSCQANLNPQPVAPACGSAKNGSFETAPTANLCGPNNTASMVTLSGNTWSWTCAGSNDRNGNPVTTSCSASKSTTTPTNTLKVCPTSASLASGATRQLDAYYGTGTCSDHTGDNTVTTSSSWSSNSASVASVGNVQFPLFNKGLVTAGNTAGTATITATYSGASATASITVTAGGSAPACGTASGKTYAYGTTGFGTDTQCPTGSTVSGNGFPVAGATSYWNCQNSYGTSGQCWASQASAPATPPPSGGKSISLAINPLTGTAGSQRTVNWAASGLTGSTYCALEDQASNWMQVSGCNNFWNVSSGTCTISPSATNTYHMHCREMDPTPVIDTNSSNVTATVTSSGGSTPTVDGLRISGTVDSLTAPLPPRNAPVVTFDIKGTSPTGYLRFDVDWGGDGYDRAGCNLDNYPQLPNYNENMCDGVSTNVRSGVWSNEDEASRPHYYLTAGSKVIKVRAWATDADGSLTGTTSDWATFTVELTPSAKVVKICPHNPDITLGKTQELAAFYTSAATCATTPAADKIVSGITWSSASAHITVENAGANASITGSGLGEATVTATYSPAGVPLTGTTTAKVKSLKVCPPSPTFTLNEAKSFSAYFTSYPDCPGTNGAPPASPGEDVTSGGDWKLTDMSGGNPTNDDGKFQILSTGSQALIKAITRAGMSKIRSSIDVNYTQPFGHPIYQVQASGDVTATVTCVHNYTYSPDQSTVCSDKRDVRRTDTGCGGEEMVYGTKVCNKVRFWKEVAP